MNYHLTLDQASEELSKTGEKFITLLKHGSMSVELYKPHPQDLQTPHLQDEIYVIASGTSEITRNGEIINCKQGDVIFVPANMEHGFINFSPDFSTWVIFYGKDGGESTVAG